ncbi:MAG: response regulator [Bradyrhizobium sp.]|uniref:response regulator n=1 Tax=Bradyrhizobium sp. TaxID=376 RepID=UPI001224EBF4|nr:response regulator [Bradyrhizobium sp.]THD57495.1 MAG: response regulator [Bradyrhizobium sp.]
MPDPDVTPTKSAFPDPNCVDGAILRLEMDHRTLALEARVMDKFEKNKVAPKMLIADDDPCVLRAVTDRCTRMGFDVQTASSGLQALIKASQHQPDILVIDVHMPEVDGLSVLTYLRDIAKKSLHVIVVTGHPGQEIVNRCKEFDASYIHKGHNFWSEFEASLIEIWPQRAVAIKQSGKRWVKIEVRKRPRVLLVDDDVSVKKFLFWRFEKLGAELLYAADGMQGFWMARRQEPTVIVSDYCMPNGDAEYLLTRLRNVPETRNIPVIVQSGRRLNDAIKQRLRREICGQPGAARILRKSADARELFEVLQRLCGFASDLDGELLYQ